MDSAPPDERDALVARAMDRVLDAERAARASIADCEKESEERLEQARQRRRVLLERARARIVALHARAARAIELRDGQLREQSRREAEESAASLADRARVLAALERLAQRLTSSG